MVSKARRNRAAEKLLSEKQGIIHMLFQKNRCNHTKPWLAEDIDQLAELIGAGRSIPEMADQLGRSQEAVRTKANDLNFLPKRARRTRNEMVEATISF